MLNLFPKIKAPYYIFTPPYTHTSAGVRALHLLCHALNQSDQRAYLVFTQQPTSCAVNVNLNTSWVMPEHQIMYKGVDPIVVYPDIIKGNPANAKKVVRWLLGYPGVCGGDTVFPDNEQLWGYSTKIARSVGSDKVLCLPVVDPSIFYEIGGSDIERKGTCYYAKKSLEIWGTDISIPEGCVKLEGTSEQIAGILRSSQKCYIYEDSSVILEARMCGCPVEYVHNEKFKDSHTSEDWDGLYYEQIISNFNSQLARFINETQRL